MKASGLAFVVDLMQRKARSKQRHQGPLMNLAGKRVTLGSFSATMPHSDSTSLTMARGSRSRK
jgi:hypothetical protein